jgi:hypothetical protein
MKSGGLDFFGDTPERNIPKEYYQLSPKNRLTIMCVELSALVGSAKAVTASTCKYPLSANDNNDRSVDIFYKKGCLSVCNPS